MSPSAAVALAVALLTSLPASALEPETCFSRQHQGAAVNVRAALNRDATAMMARTVRSERDCVLACCSEEVRTGARCNMAAFKANRRVGEDNCLLFHCPSEADCPLMKAPEGSNTYDIYKGLSHPPTLRPVPMTTVVQTTASTSAPTTPTTTQPTSAPTTAQTPPSTTEPPPPVIIIATVPAGTPPTSTAKTTTTTTTTAATTTTAPSPTFTARKPNKTSKKQNKPSKKGKPHPPTTTTTQTPSSSITSLPSAAARKEVEHKNTSVPETTTAATTSAPTTTPTPTTSSTTTTSTTPTVPMTSTAPPTATVSPTTTTAAQTTTSTPPTTTVTAPPPSLIFIPKDPDLQPGHPNLNSSSSRGKAVAAPGALTGGVVAFMVLGLAVVTLALALGGRKAMESFDRRHYTRLELNDLHYEI